MKLDVQTRNELKRRYSAQIQNHQWALIAKELKVNRGNLWKVWHGEVRSNKIRKALGLPILGACSCGKTHKCKTAQQIERRKKSSDLAFLKFIQDDIVPWLREKEAKK